MTTFLDQWCNSVISVPKSTDLSFFFFHLYKSNSQLRVDLKGNIYYYANMNPVDPQKENRFIILLVCLVKHSQKCHIFYVPSMSAL